MHLKRGYWIILAGAGVLLIVGLLTWQYIVHDESRLFALDARTGHVQWSTPLQATHAYPPTASGGMVFAISKLVHPGTLSAFDAETGQQLWEYVIDLQQFEWVDYSIYNPPVSNGHQVAVGINGNTLGVLDAGSGALLWHITGIVNLSNTQAFTFAGDRLITISQDRVLQALDAQTGTPVWQSALGSHISLEKPAITANDQLVFVSGYHSIEAFDLQSGIVRFSVEASWPSQLQAIGDTLYINTTTSLIAVDAATGASRWTFTVPVPGSYPWLFGMQTAGQVTYVMNVFSSKGGAWLFALNASNGQELWRRQLRTTTEGLLFDSFQLSPVSNDEAFFVILNEQDVENDLLMAFSAADGAELWHFSIRQRGYFTASPTSQDDLVFVTDRAPRWRNWLACLNLVD